MTTELWPAARVGEALAKLAGSTAKLNPPAAIADNPEAFGDWIEAAATSLGIEAAPAETSYAGLDEFLRTAGPALIRVGAEYLVLEPGKPVPPAVVRSMLRGQDEAVALGQIGQILDRSGIPQSKRGPAQDAILRERFATTRIRGIWRLRLPPSASFWRQVRQAGIPGRFFALAGAHAIQYGLWIAAWWVVGRGVLNARPEQGWLLTWALLLLALVPLRVLITWLQGRIAIAAGALLKLRLFFGALRLDPDSIRHQGVGQLLGRVIESEAVEALALSGGFLGLVAAIELVASIFVLAAGAAGIVQPLLLAAWIVAGAMVGRQFFQRSRAWTDERLTMTHHLVEAMVGYRTRLAQLPPDRWHTGEEDALARYLKVSKNMDNSTAALLAVVPRGWLVLGLLGLAPAFWQGTSSPAEIAIAVGGVLLAYRALKRLAAGAWQLAGAAVAWERVGVLFQAATRPEVTGSLEPLVKQAESRAVVEASDLVFRYGERAGPVLRGCNLQMKSGDRVVLEGPSGGGKSTLVSLLIGLREPSSGRLLIDGFDRQALGARGWRRRIAAAPQFHENHVLTETFAFNLLMGRPGLPSPADLREAEEVCEELGLGDVLSRMPARMLQLVGETGWQLSHGERSRLYIARAILQAPEVVVLDESFAALDPENLQRAVECVVRRARTLLVVAHR